MIITYRAASIFIAAILCMPVETSAAASQKYETAILAGGCFWGTEGVYEHVKGVADVVSGYAGGTMAFGGRSGERTGFAEAVRIRFDPAQVSYEQLLQIFFTVAHDPTQVNRQGPDVGERYRSAIFPQNADQRRIAERYLADLRTSKRFSKPIATRIETGGFQVAESEHQDFIRKHPKSQYVIVYDLPKLQELRETYPNFWRV